MELTLKMISVRGKYTGSRDPIQSDRYLIMRTDKVTCHDTSHRLDHIHSHPDLNQFSSGLGWTKREKQRGSLTVHVRVLSLYCSHAMYPLTEVTCGLAVTLSPSARFPLSFPLQVCVDQGFLGPVPSSVASHVYLARNSSLA